MAQTSDAASAPFDRLTLQEIGAVAVALDIGRSRPGDPPLSQRALAPSDGL